MKSFLFALQFLTSIPVKIKNFDRKKFSHATLYFPVVGLILGLVLSLLYLLLTSLGLRMLSINITLVVSLIILSAGLHLDGLSDTFDAFLSRKNKEEMLIIMRDSHMGVMGALSIICALLLKIALLYSIKPSLIMIALILMCILSRWSFVFVMFIFPYARQEGKAKIFIEGLNVKIFLFCAVITILLAAGFWNIKGLAVFLIATASIYLFGKLFSRRLGGITGDLLGAISEITEIVVLFSICILTRS